MSTTTTPPRTTRGTLGAIARVARHIIGTPDAAAVRAAREAAIARHPAKGVRGSGRVQ